MNSSREREIAALRAAMWPRHRLGEAVSTLARCAGLPVERAAPAIAADGLDSEQLSTWIAAAAGAAGIEAEQVSYSVHDLPQLIGAGTPLLLRITLDEREGFLALASGGGRAHARAIGSDLRWHRIPVAVLDEQVRKPVERPIAPAIDRLLDAMALTARRRARARAALLTERTKLGRFRGCWLLRMPAGSALRDEAREIRLAGPLAILFAAQLLQHVLFVLSWWLLGRAVLNGTVDRSWLLGWMLLLISLIPFRLLATWSQGFITTTAGAWLRRRLLRGALRIERETVRRQGAGELFGTLVESAAIESLALAGGIAALFSVVELGLAAGVLWLAAGRLPGVLLIGWSATVVWLGLQYLNNRRAWTSERLASSHQLLEAMVGQRTRLAQQPADQWHPDEDAALAQYAERARAMDRTGIWLTAVSPRGWLAVALVGLIPAMVSQPSPAQIGVALGGILLAYRSLKRLSAGLSSLGSAVIAAGSVRRMISAAARRGSVPNPSAMADGNVTTASRDATAIVARDLAFRYPGMPEPVLQGCSLVVPQGARLLLEGPSGTGKSTLAAVLAGLQVADSGLLLIDGLDRSVLGQSGWRKHVVMAPQAHDNFLIGGTLAFNLLMGRRWPAHPSDFAEAEAVCRELGLGDLLDRLPGGLHQIVGETGWQLSQGERTRVFLARAILQNANVLILDESFGTLDPENVDRASQCVQRRAQTVIAIAHA